jgi:hypothetical protein
MDDFGVHIHDQPKCKPVLISERFHHILLQLITYIILTINHIHQQMQME